MSRFGYLLLVSFLLVHSLFAEEASIPIMPLSEVREGMMGTGRTVFKGNEIEEFQVEILGILHNYLPQQSLILGVLRSRTLEETGVISGMSGSPVFVDGRMIGAVAYSWPFSKTPIAGITPIESMLETQSLPMEQIPIAPPIELSNYYNFESLLTGGLPSLPSPIQAPVPGFGNIQLTPISLPLMVAGAHPQVIDRFKPLFGALGLQPLQAGTMGASEMEPGPPLEPGSPLSVSLIRGDLDMGAIGTVTYRDQDKILAFGHPFFNLGPIDFPMATAQIFAIVPSLLSSFKVGASGSIVGSIRQDLHAAVFGIVGRKSPMIPIRVHLNEVGKEKRSFEFEVVHHKLLAPILLDLAFQNSVLITNIAMSESTLGMSGTIRLKDNRIIPINNLFSGSGSFTGASQYFAAVLYMIMANEFQTVDIKDIEIDVDVQMKRNEAELVEVWLDRKEVRAGETLTMKAVYRPLYGEKKAEEFQFYIPPDQPPGKLQFVVGSGLEISQQEYAQYGKSYQPDNFDQLIRLLSNLRSQDRIYVKAFVNEPSLVIRGQALYRLPSSTYSVLSSSQTIGTTQRINSLTLWEDSRPIDTVLKGTRVFSVQVLPHQN